jgi:3-methyladenine DNA glycosylase AlkC
MSSICSLMNFMGTKITFYTEKLKSLKDWESYLLKESGLPGPRGNIELAQAFADLGNEEKIKEYLTIKTEEAPENSAKVFLTFCAIVGLGTLINKGKPQYLKQLRQFASDSRWRIREAVAMSLQRIGDINIEFLLQEMEKWSKGKRAAIAALCEPRLLSSAKIVGSALKILDDVTTSFASLQDRSNEDFDVLRKGLAYCWSVAVAGYPEKGKKLIEKWVKTKDKDVSWIMKQNLKKNRLLKMYSEWASSQLKLLI